MIKRWRTYYQIWAKTAGFELQQAFLHRGTSIIFMLGKIFRLSMMLFFLWLIQTKVRSIAGYTSPEIIVFYLTYNLVDLFAQIAYRGVYEFGPKVKNGTFDFYLAKPISPLFQALATKNDPIDTLLLIPNLLLSAVIINRLELNITLSSIGLFLLLFINSFLLATALHTLVLCLGILTTEVDNTIWLYRDINRLAQFPITMYLEPVRLALFFLVPVGMMITIPAQVLINRQPSYTLGVVTIFTLIFGAVSAKIWQWSLKRYSSASS
jgi:ABC-2 type transport system permease protein